MVPSVSRAERQTPEMDGIGGVASSGLPAIGHGAACVPTARRTRYGGNAVSSDRDRAETMPFTPELKFDDTAASQAKAPSGLPLRLRQP